MQRLAKTCLALVSLSCACSMGYVDNISGGSKDLPTLGAGPFAKPIIDFDTAAEEPFVVVQPRASLFEPTVLGRSDGGFRLWFSRQADDEDEVQIWSSEVPGILELPDVSLSPAVVADQLWEEGRVSAPTIAVLGSGDLLMIYEGGVTELGLGMATSSDDGRTWTKSPDNPVITDAVSPGVANAGGDLLLVFTRPANELEIFAASSTTGESWDVFDDAIIRNRADDGDAFDQTAVSSPSLFVRRTETGRLHYGLHFGGRDRNGDAAIGYAASFDGVEWERFLGSESVVSGNPPEETGPTLWVDGPRAFLFFSQPRQLRGAIAVGVHP